MAMSRATPMAASNGECEVSSSVSMSNATTAKCRGGSMESNDFITESGIRGIALKNLIRRDSALRR